MHCKNGFETYWYINIVIQNVIIWKLFFFFFNVYINGLQSVKRKNIRKKLKTAKKMKNIYFFFFSSHNRLLWTTVIIDVVSRWQRDCPVDSVKNTMIYARHAQNIRCTIASFDSTSPDRQTEYRFPMKPLYNNANDNNRLFGNVYGTRQ